MLKDRIDWYEHYKDSQAHVAQLQTMLEYTYNSRQFWLKMFWWQSITAYLILLFN